LLTAICNNVNQNTNENSHEQLRCSPSA